MSTGPASAWVTVATRRSSASENQAGVVDSSSTSPSASLAPDDRGAQPRADRARSGRDHDDGHRRRAAVEARGSPSSAGSFPARSADRACCAAGTRSRRGRLSVSPSMSDTEPRLNSTMSPRRSSAIRSTVSRLGSVDAAVAMSSTSWAAASVRPACASSTSATRRSIPGDAEPSAGLRHAGSVAAPVSAPICAGRLMTLLGSQPARRGAVDAEG